MTEPRSTEDSPHEWLRFAVDGHGAAERVQALDNLVRVLAKLKSEEEGRQFDASDEQLAALERMLPPAARASFARPLDPSAWRPPGVPLEAGWDACTMFGRILACAYELVGVFPVHDGREAELRFEALGWPFGGLGGLIRLVEAFGFEVLTYFDGTAEVSRVEYLAASRRT